MTFQDTSPLVSMAEVIMRTKVVNVIILSIDEAERIVKRSSDVVWLAIVFVVLFVCLLACLISDQLPHIELVEIG